MAINQINAYSYGTNSTSGTNSASGTSQTSASKNSSVLGLNDFLQLLAAQFANQDVMNPTDNTEYISQMAQFSALQAMQELSQISYTQYGASLVGKKVVVASYDTNGKYQEDTGIVDSVNFATGSNVLVVNGKAYDISSVMKVVNPDAATPPDETPDDPDDPDTPDVPDTGGESV
ncbi:flagellar hook capping FlgD N-terminal domain-containing protein [Caproiciproducens sp. R1]|uniref:flagellar hook capping FlgD N-terminal domain-containing protein n=1 Tax=Caproiciproducens sp. R1 TaxID=3435000 RepID=UPI004034C141